MKAYGIEPSERAKLAELIEVHDQYLYQCLTKKKDMEARLAADAEVKTGGRLRRWMLRRDWRQVWPELVNAKGAPSAEAGDTVAVKPAAIKTGKAKQQRAAAEGSSDDKSDAGQPVERRTGERRAWDRGHTERRSEKAQG